MTLWIKFYGVIQSCSIFNFKSNQNFYYTRCITPERVTSLRGPTPRYCAQATQLLLKKYYSGGIAVDNTVSDLTGPKFEPQTSRSRDERVGARPTGQFIFNLAGKSL